MPYIWKEPERVVLRKGVSVYHAYKDECASTYWYTLDPNDDDWESEAAFDIRELEAYKTSARYPHKWHELDSKEGHAAVLRMAINDGELKAPSDQPKPIKTDARRMLDTVRDHAIKTGLLPSDFRKRSL